MTDKKPFSDLRVLDFTAGVAGPHATQIMSQNGADVIKIEPLHGDWVRALGKSYGDVSAHSIAFNRGKQSLAIDMKAPEGRAIVQKLAEGADIVAESFRPGVMARFGLSHADLAAKKPELIYLSVSGFGQDGPYNDRPVTDAVIQAFSGWMVMNKNGEGVPQRSGMVAMDVLTGLYAYNAVASAVIERFRYGTGKWIECSLMQAAAAFQIAKVIEYHLQDGQVGNLYAPVGAFGTVDGQISITTMRDDHFTALCRVLELDALPGDTRFATVETRLANEPALKEILAAAFKTRTSQEWAEKLTAAEVMNSIVNSYGDFLNNPHVQAVGAVKWLDQPGLGSVPVVQSPGIANTDVSSPHIGQDSRAVLRAAGYGDSDVASLIQRGIVGVPEPA